MPWIAHSEPVKPMKESKHLLLIDLSGIFRAAWHSSADQELNAAASKTIDAVAAVSSGHEHVVCCLDSPPYARRLALLPAYKAHREAPSEALIDQFRRVKERLANGGDLLWRVEGEEADDVIASAVARARTEGWSVTIASSDKDLLLLVDDDAGVEVFSPLKRKSYRRADVIEQWGVPPESLLDALALQGDTSDNVPGVRGVGPKTAAGLIREFGTLDGALANVDKVKTPKLQENLFTFANAARLAREVIRLRSDLPVPWGQLTAPRAKPAPMEPEMQFEDAEISESEPENAAPPPEPRTVDAQTTALAVVAPDGGWNNALEPVSLGQAMRLANGLAQSKLYTRYPNAEAIWAVIIRGREMGLGALTALDSFHIIEGKPSPSAHLLIARCMSHPDCEYFQMISSSATEATYETRRRGQPHPTRLTYTIEQAREAGLMKPTSNWARRPDEMIRKTCGVQLGRIVYPETMLGLVSEEERS